MSFIKLIIMMSILSICWWRKNIIFMLLSLEMLLMSLFILLNMNNCTNMFMSLLIMATIMVSGSSLGLAFLVALSRNHNSSNCTFIWNMMFDNYFNLFIIVYYNKTLFNIYIN